MSTNNPQNQPTQKMKVIQAVDYRETYTNSVQVRSSVLDFQVVFGVASPDGPDAVQITNQSGVFLSPQQAKVLFNVLGQHLAQYEQAFGAIKLEPQGTNLPPNLPQGPVN
ncbi:DUF3467 domain-containing protein [Telmatobacter bradus]|uniref:DUF3467 domain-containing protein n=1 Tax=Telmatobacter bradus TaxID=474953 RepID=UPI003B42C1FA